MATSELEHPPFDWGDSVRIVDDELATTCGYSIASVCGLRVVDEESTVREFAIQCGTWLILIELPDGRSLEVPAHKLERLSE
jgi:hypothetical protein